LDVVTELSDGVTFEELQYCFLAWMERFQWVSQNSGEYFMNWYKVDLEIYGIDEIRDGVSLPFSHPISGYQGQKSAFSWWFWKVSLSFCIKNKRLRDSNRFRQEAKVNDKWIKSLSSEQCRPLNCSNHYLVCPGFRQEIKCDFQDAVCEPIGRRKVAFS
jgi:hypothetical protein